jgi:TPR repeat protein
MDSRNSPNWFIDQLTLYQAANSSNEAIKQNFLIRIAEFELIIADLHTKKGNDPTQHELILGRRGSGKSTLLKRIQIEIEEDVDLFAKYIAINLAEEQAAIYRLSDLWFEVLQELMLKLEAKKKLQDFDSFDENQDYTRYLYAEIHELLRGSQKKVVLLLDNLDRILESFDDDGHLLRETLLNYNDLQIIGGSTRMDEHFWQYDKPFYEFFRRHRLEGLSFEEIRLLLNHWSNAMQLPVLKDFALRNRGKIEAIRIFTDGLPRALQFFIQILLHDSTLYGFDYLRKVMDRATPLYQERLNNLTAPQRKIILEMAFWWQAAPTKVLVEKCRMEGKLISSYLKQLERFGIVETLNTGNKNHLYRISERFFNMWLIVTQGNPEQKRHAKYLTLFLETWYGGQELKELALEHIEKLKEGKISYDKAVILSKAFSQSKHIGVEERDALIDYTLQLNGDSMNNSELPRKYKDILLTIKPLSDKKKYMEALEKIEEIENEGDGIKFSIKGYFYDELGKKEEAESYYLQAIRKGSTVTSYNLAILYENQGKNAEAERYYLKAIEIGIGNASNNLAILYENQNEIKKAEKHYLIAIEKGVVNAMSNLAVLYESQGKIEDAEKYYKQTIVNGQFNILNNLAILYYETNQKKDEALYLSNKYYKNLKYKSKFKNIIIIEIWNGIFENLDEKIEQVLKESAYEELTWFIENLLYLEQKQLVLSLFESEKHGKALKSRYELLYFATLILAQKTEGNLLLKIPPEVLPTVEEIVADVKAKQAFYAQRV